MRILFQEVDTGDAPYTCYIQKWGIRSGHPDSIPETILDESAIPPDDDLSQDQRARCCYDASDSLISDPWAVDGNNIFQRFQAVDVQEFEKGLFTDCCSQTNIESGLSSEGLCSQFQERRPPSECFASFLTRFGKLR